MIMRKRRLFSTGLIYILLCSNKPVVLLVAIFFGERVGIRHIGSIVSVADFAFDSLWSDYFSPMVNSKPQSLSVLVRVTKSRSLPFYSFFLFFLGGPHRLRRRKGEGGVGW